MTKNLLIVNLKHYQNAAGHELETFLKSCPDRVKQENWDLEYAIGIHDARLAEPLMNKRLISQHVDDCTFGPFTGKTSIEVLKNFGIKGSLLNHSEHRIDFNTIGAVVKRASELEFQMIVCAENLEEIDRIAQMHPHYIAYEPKELIGGNISVSSAKPAIISRAKEICQRQEVGLIVGAGVKSAVDMKKSVELGASGVLIASGIVLSKDPGDKIQELLD